MLQNTSTVLPTLIIMSFWGFGGRMIIYLAGLNGINQELYEAARIDGASSARMLFTIKLPLLTPAIMFNVIMSLIGGMQVFTEAYIAAGHTTRFLVQYLYIIGYQDPMFVGLAAAMAWILFIIILMLTAVNFLLSKWYVHYES